MVLHNLLLIVIKLRQYALMFIVNLLLENMYFYDILLHMSILSSEAYLYHIMVILYLLILNM